MPADDLEGAREQKCSNPDCGQVVIGSPKYCPHCGTQHLSSGPSPGRGDADNTSANISKASLVADVAVDKAPIHAIPFGETSERRLDGSQIAWLTASALAVIAGFFVVHPRTVAPLSAQVTAPQEFAPAPSSQENVAPAQPSTQTAPAIAEAKLSAEPSLPFDQVQVQTTFAQGSSVGIALHYTNANLGDKIDAGIYSGGTQWNSCQTFLVQQTPEGYYWCKMQNISPGVYEFRVAINGQSSGVYSFNAVTAQPDAPHIGTEYLSLAAAFVEKYWSVWSSENDASGSWIRSFYAPIVTYYGKTISIDQLMLAKGRFAQRWPVRSYVPVASSVNANCNTNGVCVVTGVVAWQCADITGARRSTGSANFAFTTEGGKITAESGAVISRTFTK